MDRKTAYIQEDSHQGKDVDYDKISCSVDYLKKSRFNGLFVNGTLGEGLSLSLEERKQSLEEWMRHAEGLQLVAHIGTGNLKDTQELARHAERIGVDAIAALPPTYYKPANEEQLVEYVIGVTNAAPNTPFLYYEYDVTTGLHLNIPLFLRLAKHRVPTLYGVKHTTADLNSALNCALACRRKYKIFYGTDAMYLPALSLGLDDVISVPVMGTLLHLIKTNFLNGNTKEAQKCQETALRLRNIQQEHGGGIAVAKATFELMSGIPMGGTRLPLHTLTEATKEKLRADLEEGGFLRGDMSSDCNS
ncbi:N-acetylneuraminate lyase-like [Dreissena polymorpha]|uniref:N-acetylneuraminate lyase-like n=1 Tax=Dreissena polymorpha TaxID=45954 RepID=UPI00226456B3|nr:N-acetylneuraminate lyase-like [Dreissena polymorpha]